MAETAQNWMLRAEQSVNCGGSGSTGNLPQNLLISKAYAEMYLSNPKVFKWAGMAAFASATVGLGILGGKMTDVFVDAQYRSARAKSLEASALSGGRAPALPDVKERINATDIDNMLIAGNKAVFRDIYWQHLAYRENGLEPLLGLLGAMRNNGLLVEGWKTIDRGAKLGITGMIWAGNQLLLQYEQQFTLQRVYDSYAETADMLSYALISPLPDQLAAFQFDFPGGSIREFHPRWTWITTRLLPQWRQLDAGGLESRIRLIVMGNMPKRVICIQ